MKQALCFVFLRRTSQATMVHLDQGLSSNRNTKEHKKLSSNLKKNQQIVKWMRNARQMIMYACMYGTVKMLETPFQFITIVICDDVVNSCVATILKNKILWILLTNEKTWFLKGRHFKPIIIRRFVYEAYVPQCSQVCRYVVAWP